MVILFIFLSDLVDCAKTLWDHNFHVQAATIFFISLNVGVWYTAVILTRFVLFLCALLNYLRRLLFSNWGLGIAFCISSRCWCLHLFHLVFCQRFLINWNRLTNSCSLSIDSFLNCRCVLCLFIARCFTTILCYFWYATLLLSCFLLTVKSIFYITYWIIIFSRICLILYLYTLLCAVISFLLNNKIIINGTYF